MNSPIKEACGDGNPSPCSHGNTCFSCSLLGHHLPGTSTGSAAPKLSKCRIFEIFMEFHHRHDRPFPGPFPSREWGHGTDSF